MKAKVLTGGLEAKPVCPYHKFKGDKLNPIWVEWDNANPPLPLTEKCPEGLIIECNKVWQYESPDTGWTTSFESTIQQKIILGYAIREALEPVAPISEKEEYHSMQNHIAGELTDREKYLRSYVDLRDPMTVTEHIADTGKMIEKKSVAQLLVDEFAEDLPTALWEMYNKAPDDGDINWAKQKIAEYRKYHPIVEQSASVEMQIVDRIRHQVDNGSGGDHISEYFVKVAKEYSGNPSIDVRHYENSNDRLSVLKIDDKTVATVIETRTEFNHVEFVFSKWQQSQRQQEADNWLPISEYPQDSPIVQRWHKIYKCIVSVKHRRAYAEYQCEWLNGTLDNTWPEAAFEPFFKLLPKNPTT